MNKAREPKAYTIEAQTRDAAAANLEYEKNYAKTDIDMQREANELEEAQKRVRLRGDIQQVIKMPEARRMLWRILELGGPYRKVFDKDHSVMSNNEGKREIALDVLAMLLDADPGVYVQMQRENLSDRKSEQKKKETEDQLQ